MWEPTPRQAEFLAAPEDEVLYGGAAGGGKTDAIVLDALGLQFDVPSIQKPKYRAIIFRRTYPELREVMDRTHQYYPQIVPGCKPNGTDHFWTFPSGARIEFGYLENDSDRFRYQSREFQYIGWEELTQWATDIGYRYLLSRNRSSDPTIPIQVRSTCNPGGVGDWWVRDRFKIDDAGSPSRTSEVIIDTETGETKTVWRRFIPATLKDNPHLGFEYRAKLLQMSEQEQAALLHGRWDIFDVEGSIYAPQIKQAIKEGRICPLPIDQAAPVNTFWDLGRNDQMAIVFHQRVGAFNHFFDYYENRLQDLSHYAKLIKDKGYLYGRHYMPHDVKVTDLSAKKTRQELLEDMGVKPIVVVPRVRHIIDGIELTRVTMASCKWDPVGCEKLLRALRAYRYVRDEKINTFKPEPLHDWSSNAADAFRQFAQGYTPDNGFWGAQQSEVGLSERRSKSIGNLRRNSGGDWIT